MKVVAGRWCYRLLLVGLMSTPLTACGDSGMADPEGFFHAHRAELQQVVQDLSASGISWVGGSTPYLRARKVYASELDAVLYKQLQKFIARHDVLSIVIGHEDKAPWRLDMVSFRVRITNEAGFQVIYVIQYTPPNVKYSTPFENEACRILEAPSWRLCWRPA